MTAFRNFSFGLLLALTTTGAAPQQSIKPADPASIAEVKSAPTFAQNWETSFIVHVGKGHGTGTVIHRDGLLLTCAHVVKPGAALSVAIETDTGEALVPAKIVARDEKRDLAVISVKVRFPRAAELEADGEIMP